MIEFNSLFSLHPLILFFAFLLDLSIGDPRWLPHPVRIIGRLINKTENLIRGSEDTRYKIQDSRLNIKDRFKGVFLVIIIVGSTFFITWLIVHTIGKVGSISLLLFYFSTALLIYLVSTTIATKELIDSAKVVIESLKNKEIDSARKNLSMIVGRDTKDLSEKGILKATIETLSENLSDGIIAPLFYLVIGGLPLAMAYKAINTLDSMVGYKNDKYKDFGWASARLDDIANYIPARISGILIVIVSFFISRSLSTVQYSLIAMIRDGRKHLSPNAGIPEAAMAGALGVRLGGPSTYEGVVVKKPFIGEEKTDDYLSASERAIKIIKVSSIIGVTLAGVILYAKQ